jgi:hypothetical protein
MVFKSSSISAEEKISYGYVVIVFISVIIVIGVSRGLYSCLNPIWQRRYLSKHAIRVPSTVALENPIESTIPTTESYQPGITLSGPLKQLSRDEAQHIIKQRQSNSHEF